MAVIFFDMVSATRRAPSRPPAAHGGEAEAGDEGRRHNRQRDDLGRVVEATRKTDHACREIVQAIQQLLGLNTEKGALVALLTHGAVIDPHADLAGDQGAGARRHRHPFLAHADAGLPRHAQTLTQPGGQRVQQ
jgi:hypothetical protein